MAIKPLLDLCTPRDSVFDVSNRDTVLNLNHLVEGKIDGRSFFEENYVTDGMRTLLTEAFRRLEGKSEQAVFKLTQPMVPEFFRLVSGAVSADASEPIGDIEVVEVSSANGEERVKSSGRRPSRSPSKGRSPGKSVP